MRLVKLLVAMACAFLLATAIGGAGIASADTPCKVSTNPCPEASTFSGSNSIKGGLVAGTTVLLKNSIVNVKCTSSAWTGSFSTDGTGEFSAGEIATLTFGGPCETVTAEPCSIFVAKGLHYGFSMSASSAGNGTITIFKPALEVECGTGPSIRCTFTAPLGSLPLEVTGGTPAKAKANAVSLQREGTICPASAELTAEYEISAPSPLFIVKEVAPPVLCKKNVAPCLAGDIYPTGTTVKAEFEANSKFTYSYNSVAKEPACKVSKAEGKTTEAGAAIKGEWSLFTLKECGGGVCTMTATNFNRFEINRTGGGNGTMRWYGSTGSPSVEIICNAVEKCNYSVGEVSFTLTGGTPAKLLSQRVTLNRKSSLETLCSATATWEGVGGVEEVKYTLIEPSPLFVRS
jgi:hypothetical protein